MEEDRRSQGKPVPLAKGNSKVLFDFGSMIVSDSESHESSFKCLLMFNGLI